MSGKKRVVEELWRDFFSKTSEWLDHRTGQINPRFPDFKHKHTGESLWLADSRKPPWVEAELAAIPSGTLRKPAFVWNQKLREYAKSRQYRKTLEVFDQMQQEGVGPDPWTFVPVLNSCAGLGALEKGRCVHKKILQVGCDSDVYLGNSLVDMYAKCGSLEDARRVFKNMTVRTVVTWNVMIGAYVKSEQGLKALELYHCMQQEGFEPDSVTFLGALNACATVPALEKGRSIHEQIIGKGYESDVKIGSCLVDMYAKCGSMEHAERVFKKMPVRTVATWNVMIGAYVKSGQGLKALDLFRSMQQEGFEPDSVTFVGALNACASVLALQQGRCIHEQVIRKGCESNLIIGSCLVDMYAKCGSMEDAGIVFKKMPVRDVVTWTAMIGGYVKSGQGLEALQFFRSMQQEGIEPDSATFLGALNACASLGALEQGRCVHEQIIRKGCESELTIGSCLVNMYAKCGSMEDAGRVFEKMPVQSVVTWTLMIGAYVKSGQGLKALELFRNMQQEGFEPDSVAFVGALNACASVAALEQGKSIHEQIIQKSYDSDVSVGNCLVDMYAKCGSMEDAARVFKKMPVRDVVTWNVMIGAYAMHGNSEEAIGLFEQMDKEGVEINDVTFTCLLSACSHGSLMKEGLAYFESMRSRFNVVPTAEHYTCMVDLFGRAGQLGAAEEFAKSIIPFKSSACAWKCLLGACRIHGDVEIAERAAKWCLELDSENASTYVLLSNTYAAAGQWDKSAAVAKRRLNRKVVRVPGCTWIERNGVVHSFVVDDKELLKQCKSVLT